MNNNPHPYAPTCMVVPVAGGEAAVEVEKEMV